MQSAPLSWHPQQWETNARPNVHTPCPRPSLLADFQSAVCRVDEHWLGGRDQWLRPCQHSQLTHCIRVDSVEKQASVGDLSQVVVRTGKACLGGETGFANQSLASPAVADAVRQDSLIRRSTLLGTRSRLAAAIDAKVRLQLATYSLADKGDTVPSHRQATCCDPRRPSPNSLWRARDTTRTSPGFPARVPLQASITAATQPERRAESKLRLEFHRSEGRGCQWAPVTLDVAVCQKSRLRQRTTRQSPGCMASNHRLGSLQARGERTPREYTPLHRLELNQRGGTNATLVGRFAQFHSEHFLHDSTATPCWTVRRPATLRRQERSSPELHCFLAPGSESLHAKPLAEQSSLTTVLSHSQRYSELPCQESRRWLRLGRQRPKLQWAYRLAVPYGRQTHALTQFWRWLGARYRAAQYKSPSTSLGFRATAVACAAQQDRNRTRNVLLSDSQLT